MDVFEMQFGPVIPQEIVDKVEDYEIMDKEQQEEAEEAEKQKFAALAFLEGANRDKFGKVLAEMNNNFVKGTTHYPENVEDALQILTEWANWDGSSNQKKFKPKRGAAFA